ncbi:N-methyl-L-tryptophan oxidase [Nesterenkonia ebinurensis]|uniref:N-methyl-L-tryptophan oxidase n=1 Tax=Nesterenkonia ebinurensis TaxID=2608252 RepID=UPI001CC7D3DE|nr:N-methyl-L-tryptophan oxidase [Nesterenkonia ebinurensis]
MGVGTMGSQALWQLATRGCDVTGYEQYNLAHTQGAAGGETRLFRTIQVEDSGYVPIAKRADEIYRQLEKESGKRIRDLTGALIMGSSSSGDMKSAIDASNANPDGTELFSRKESKKKFPEYELDKDDISILDKGGGIIYSENAIRQATGLAVSSGAKLREGTVVQALEETSRGVKVVSTEGIEQYDSVVVTTGAWMAQIVPEVQDWIRPRRLVSMWFSPKKERKLSSMLPYLRVRPTYSYGLPSPDGKSMKLGLETSEVDEVKFPQGNEYIVPDSIYEEFSRLIESYHPALSHGPKKVQSYYESYTPTEYEYIGPHPESNKILIASGFSGHGFKFSPAIGEIISDLIVKGETEHNIEFITKIQS